MYNQCMSKESYSEPKFNKKRSAKTKEAWKKRLAKESGTSQNFTIDIKVIEKAISPQWWKVLNWYAFTGQQVDNIAAITGKSTRKTTVQKMFEHVLLSKYPWLQAMNVMNIKDDVSNETLSELIKVRDILSDEFGIKWLKDVIVKGTNSVYFVRDKKSKNNQEWEFNSFSKLANRSGNTKKRVIHYEELEDADNPGAVISQDLFLDRINLISSKNEENFIASGHGDVYKTFSKNNFTLNRWGARHPVIKFAEEHCPYEPVRSWFLEDPINNNFFVHYVEKANPGWKGMDRTLIVYATKFSSQMLVSNKDWLNKQLEIIERGDEQELAILLGDEYEGDFGQNKTYSWRPRDAYHHSKLPNEPIETTIGIDKDKNKELPLFVKGLHCFDEEFVIRRYGRPVYAVITHDIKPNPSSKRTWNAEVYYRLIKQQVIELGRDKPIHAFLDDDQSLWVDRFNEDREVLKNKIAFIPAKKHARWNIKERTEYGEQTIPSGFESFMDDPLQKLFLNEMHQIRNRPDVDARDERPGKNNLNKTNAWEYASYVYSSFKNQFPEGFWDFYYGELRRQKEEKDG